MESWAKRSPHFFCVLSLGIFQIHLQGVVSELVGVGGGALTMARVAWFSDLDVGR